MSTYHSRNLLDEVLASVSSSGNPNRRFILIEDFVETSGAFVLHQLARNALGKSDGGEIIVFLSFAQKFAHYDRVLRKLGCNLSVQRDKKKLFFFDLLDRQFPGDAGCRDLFAEICAATADCRSPVAIFIDDLSLLEAATGGAAGHVLDFLHYCSKDCSVVALTHGDIYSEGPTLRSHLKYLADATVKAEPLRTGSSVDVHGQLTVVGKTLTRPRTFLFRIKENAVDYFYPGTLT